MGVIARKESDAHTVRFPKGVKKKLKTLAVKNGRSFNTEVIVRLVKSINTREGEKKAG